MRRLLPYIVACLLLKMSLASHGDVIVEAKVIPEEAYLGQRVILQIDVLGSEGWTQLDKLPHIDLSGAYVMQTNSQGVRLQETVRGVGYTGQRYEFSIYPQRAGSIEIPPISIETLTRAWGSQASEATNVLETPSRSFSVVVPPGAEGIRWLVSTTRMTVRQQWEPMKTAYSVGDSIRRTLIFEAEALPGMAFPAVNLPVPEGTKAYPHQPEVEDEKNRGSLTGRRIESVSYVFQTSGNIQLPEVAFSWWNLDTGELVREVLPALDAEVHSLPVLTGSDEPGRKASTDRYPGRVWIGIGFLVFGLAIVYGWKSLRRIVRTSLAKWQNSEPAQFVRVRRAFEKAQSGCPWQEIMAWLDMIQLDGEPARMDKFLEKYGSRSGAIPLQDDVSQKEALFRSLNVARRNWKKATWSSRNSSVRNDLPSLNP